MSVNTKGYEMTKEPVVNDNSQFVNVTCDDCGIQYVARMGGVLRGRKRRGASIDLCRKCSYNTKYKYSAFSVRGAGSVRWNGGRRESGPYVQIYLGGGKYKSEDRIIVERILNRPLLKEEKVHHLDCNKRNNSPDNLFLCNSNSHHMKMHASLELCGYGLVKMGILCFDCINIAYDEAAAKQYFITQAEPDLSFYSNHSIHRRCKKYWAFWNKDQGYTCVHRAVVEASLGHKLERGLDIHHIDGNKDNNSINNLVALTASNHRRVHASLQRAAARYLNQLIVFDGTQYLLKDNTCQIPVSYKKQ